MVDLISLKEAANYLGLQPGTVQKMVQSRLILHYRFPKNTSRPTFKRDDLDRYIEAHRVETRPMLKRR